MATVKEDGVSRVDMLRMDWDKIRFDPKDNSRWEKFDASRESDRELIAALLSNGQETPVWVRRDGDGYKLVAGYRRMQAIGYINEHGITGPKRPDAEKPMQVLAILKQYNAQEAYIASIRENKDRKQTSIIDQAKQMRDLSGWMSIKDIADMYGVSEATVTHKRLPLMDLSYELQAQIHDASYSTELGLLLAEMPEEARDEVIGWAKAVKAAQMSEQTGQEVSPEEVTITTADVKKAAKAKGVAVRPKTKKLAEVRAMLESKRDDTTLTRHAKAFCEAFLGWIDETTDDATLDKEFMKRFKEKLS